GVLLIVGLPVGRRVGPWPFATSILGPSPADAMSDGRGSGATGSVLPSCLVIRRPDRRIRCEYSVRPAHTSGPRNWKPNRPAGCAGIGSRASRFPHYREA